VADEAHQQIHVVAPPPRCFAHATAFERYPEWTSDVKEVTVLARDAEMRGTRVEFHVAGLGRRVRYVLEYDFADAPHAFTWSLVEGDMLRALDGRYAFAPEGDGTLVDYTLTIDLAIPMPGLVKRRASGMIMGNALRDLKRAVEDHMTEDDAAVPAPEPVLATPPAREVVDSTVLPPPHPDAIDYDAAGTEHRPLPPPSVLESVISELLGAVPEVKDHVLEAADALLDAAKALLDAADRVVRQQRGEE
jgi:hypothetical protein